MPKFGKQSLDRLATCHPDLQKVMNEAIKHFDFTVLYGYRTPNEQFELYKKGRTFQNGKWVKTGTTVTNLDGKTKLSNHNYSPSTAIDIAPYQIDWNDTDKFKTLYDNPPSPWLANFFGSYAVLNQKDLFCFDLHRNENPCMVRPEWFKIKVFPHKQPNEYNATITGVHGVRIGSAHPDGSTIRFENTSGRTYAVGSTSGASGAGVTISET